MTDASSLQLTQRNQHRATDPLSSAWVSANAGTGKTYILVRRVLRLLLAGAAPDRILCLTYTKAAASEMSNRLFSHLAGWATAPQDALIAGLLHLLGRSATHAELVTARTLFAQSIEAPGGFKVQTIHAFCERVLKRFPLEAGLSPAFVVLDSGQSDALLRGSIDRLLTEAASDGGALGSALQTVVALAGEQRFDELMAEAVKRRHDITALLQDARSLDDPFAEIQAMLLDEFGVPRDATDDGLLALSLAVLPGGLARKAHDAWLTGSANDIKMAKRAAAVLAARSDAERHAALSACLLTEKSEPRKDQMTKAVKAAHPGLAEHLDTAAQSLALLNRQRLGLKIATGSAALLRLADKAITHFATAKARSAALDYDDLIVRMAGLLSSGLDTRWVLFKLDGGLDHILVDEAQDTNPRQWLIITALTEEFFADAGAGARLRTMFAVGDEKQSIYGFQGARPELFSRTGSRLEAAAKAAASPFVRVPLTLSFRTVAPVLAAVDAVFATPEAAAGLTAEGDVIRHEAFRIGHAGLVEIWPVETTEAADPGEPWAPGAERGGPAAAAERLADRIAATIGDWIAAGERLVSEDRLVTPGDVLILLSKRQPLGPLIIRSLKARGLPVAGADRIKVTKQIGVMDLTSLGRFLLLPEDDLALAEVLLSPLTGLTDDDLFLIGHGRKGSLWNSLLAKAGDDPRFAEVASTLRRWRSQADFLPPFEFYNRLLDKDGRRAALLARLGPEAGDAIDEFLNLAISYDATEPPSLQGFLDWLGRADPEIKRDMDQGRQEIRIMTVHGAKGLEAPIVILPDTCSAGKRGSPPLLPLGEGGPLVWMLKDAKSLVGPGKAKSAHDETLRQERNRLLYVAMTRARDRLYIGGFEGTKKRSVDCWYDQIADALRPLCQTVELANGGFCWRLETGQTAPPKPVHRVEANLGAAAPYPEWALRNAPRAEARNVPLTPSRLAPLETEEGSGLAAPATAMPGPRGLAAGNRFLRGSLTHSLLQYLPELSPAVRKAAAVQFLALRAGQVPAALRTNIVDEVLAVLEHRHFAAAFGPGSAAEVPIAAEITLPSGGPPLRITGQIDRLIVAGNSVTIIDFKTNRPPPADIADAPAAYLLQLAAYRLAIKHIYAAQNVVAALLWTDGARLMPVEAEILDLHENAILSGQPWP